MPTSVQHKISVDRIITKESALDACAGAHKGTGSDTKKKCFSRHSGIQEEKQNPTFSVPLNQSFLKTVFEEQTGFKLKANPNPKFMQFYCFINNKLDMQKIKEWERQQGDTVYIADNLTASIALDYNYIDNTSGKKTELGDKEERAKYLQDPASIAGLVQASVTKINELTAFKNANLVCAVPCSASKSFDLPRRLASDIATIMGKEDITPSLVLGAEKMPIKNLALAQKWDAWDAASVTCKKDISGQKVILIDDKYQSGLTLHYAAMKLQQAGASAVYGLCIVKTLRDTDNAS